MNMGSSCASEMVEIAALDSKERYDLSLQVTKWLSPVCTIDWDVIMEEATGGRTEESGNISDSSRGLAQAIPGRCIN